MSTVYWLLMFFPVGASAFDGGMYQTRLQCEQAAVHQLQKWRQDYGPRIRWSCRYVEEEGAR